MLRSTSKLLTLDQTRFPHPLSHDTTLLQLRKTSTASESNKHAFRCCSEMLLVQVQVARGRRSDVSAGALRRGAPLVSGPLSCACLVADLCLERG